MQLHVYTESYLVSDQHNTCDDTYDICSVPEQLTICMIVQAGDSMLLLHFWTCYVTGLKPK